MKDLKNLILLFIGVTLFTYYFRMAVDPTLPRKVNITEVLSRKEVTDLYTSGVLKNNQTDRVYSRTTSEEYVLTRNWIPFTYTKIPITSRTVSYSISK
jgi:hypothetical protein